MVTYYVVQSFSLDRKRRLQADPPVQVASEGQAKRMAARLAQSASKVGVVAFSRTGDPKTGDWDDAILIYRDGGVPSEVADELRHVEAA